MVHFCKKIASVEQSAMDLIREINPAEPYYEPTKRHHVACTPRSYTYLVFKPNQPQVKIDCSADISLIELRRIFVVLRWAGTAEVHTISVSLSTGIARANGFFSFRDFLLERTKMALALVPSLMKGELR